MMVRLGYANDYEDVDNTVAHRSDYVSRWIKHNGDEDVYCVVWLGRIRPFLGSREYVLLGVDLCFPNDSFDNIDSLLEATEKLILEVKPQ